MAGVTFAEENGTSHEAEVREEDHLIHAALENNIDRIVGQCGGECACARCHVHLEERLYSALPAPTETELDMIDFTVAPRSASSRLGYQVGVREAMMGNVGTLPKA